MLEWLKFKILTVLNGDEDMKKEELLSINGENAKW